MKDPDFARLAVQHRKTQVLIESQTTVIEALKARLSPDVTELATTHILSAALRIHDASESVTASARDIRTATADLSHHSLPPSRNGSPLHSFLVGDLSRLTAFLAITIPILALVLGIIIQQHFTLLAVPDPTRGWKDRVWDRFCPEISLCMSHEAAGKGDCVI